MRVVTHQAVMRRPRRVGEGWEFVRALRASPSLGVLAATPRHEASSTRRSPRCPSCTATFLHDAHTAVLMREHGVKTIVTRDTDFHRFDFIEVVDPLRS